MKKTLSLIAFAILTTFLLINYVEVSQGIKLSFNICINSLFPSIIPFMLLSNIFIHYNFVSSLDDLLGNLVNKIFKINKSASFALFLSLFTGSPSNAKYLKDLYDNQMINEIDIEKALSFCHFMNPIFILGTVGVSFLHNKKMGLIILISHYLSGFIIGLKKRKKEYKVIKYTKAETNKTSFIKVLNEAIISTADSLLIILGIITSCIIVTTLFNSILKIRNDYKFLFGIIEVTQGLNYLSLSNFNIQVKGLIATFLLSFGGLSIHAQTLSILDNKKIRYLPYFYSRIIQAILSVIIFELLMVF